MIETHGFFFDNLLQLAELELTILYTIIYSLRKIPESGIAV